MNELEPGTWVALREPLFGYTSAQLVEFIWPKWLLSLSSGYEFSLYEDEFEVD